MTYGADAVYIHPVRADHPVDVDQTAVGAARRELFRVEGVTRFCCCRQVL